MSFRSSLIRCKSILCPLPVSFHPTNIIKPPPLLNQRLVSLSLHPQCFLFIHTQFSLHFPLYMLSISLILSAASCVPDSSVFIQTVEDTSGCSSVSSLERQQETRDLKMNVLCRGKNCLRFCLASLHRIFLLTAPSLNFHNGLLHRQGFRSLLIHYLNLILPPA